VRAVVLRRCLRVYDTSGRFSPTFNEQEVKRLEVRHRAAVSGAVTRSGPAQRWWRDIEEMRPGWPKVNPETLATTAPGVLWPGILRMVPGC
jgi:hypothetical protein